MLDSQQVKSSNSQLTGIMYNAARELVNYLTGAFSSYSLVRTAMLNNKLVS